MAKKEIKEDHIEISKHFMEILNIKISRFSDLISGIKLYESDNLLVVILNPVDFVLDGVCFINKHYLKKIEPEVNNDIKIKILENKFNNYKINYEFFESIEDTIRHLKNRKKLIELTLESPDYSLIGSVQNINMKTFILKMLSVKAKYLEEEKFEYNKIRMLTIDSDYLNSLENYIKKKPNDADLHPDGADL